MNVWDFEQGIKEDLEYIQELLVKSAYVSLASDFEKKYYDSPEDLGNHIIEIGKEAAANHHDVEEFLNDAEARLTAHIQHMKGLATALSLLGMQGSESA